MNATQSQNIYIIIGSHLFADVLENKVTKEKSLHANASFKKNEVLCLFDSIEVVNVPNYLTVQIDNNKHITLNPEFLQYTNHSCNPNVFFDTTTFEYLAIKDINVGDELTFFYPSTEWKMQQPFVCTCGFKECLQTIKGSAFLSKEIIAKYKFTNFINSKLH